MDVYQGGFVIGRNEMATAYTKEKLIENISAAHKNREFGFSKDPDKDLERIHTWTKRLIKEHCAFRIDAAANEQLPYTEKEVGFPIGTMDTKKETGRKQVLDYWVFICLNPEAPKEEQEWIQLSFGIERKSKQDWHGTLYVGKNYKRFKREINTVRLDPIIKNMYAFIECDMPEWVTYYPPVCRYNHDQIKKMIVAKEHALASVMSKKDVHVCWLGSRGTAASFIPKLSFQYAVEHYDEWLNL